METEEFPLVKRKCLSLVAVVYMPLLIDLVNNSRNLSNQLLNFKNLIMLPISIISNFFLFLFLIAFKNRILISKLICPSSFMLWKKCYWLDLMLFVFRAMKVLLLLSILLALFVCFHTTEARVRSPTTSLTFTLSIQYTKLMILQKIYQDIIIIHAPRLPVQLIHTNLIGDYRQKYV